MFAQPGVPAVQIEPAAYIHGPTKPLEEAESMFAFMDMIPKEYMIIFSFAWVIDLFFYAWVADRVRRYFRRRWGWGVEDEGMDEINHEVADAVTEVPEELTEPWSRVGDASVLPVMHKPAKKKPVRMSKVMAFELSSRNGMLRSVQSLPVDDDSLVMPTTMTTAISRLAARAKSVEDITIPLVSSSSFEVALMQARSGDEESIDLMQQMHAATFSPHTASRPTSWHKDVSTAHPSVLCGEVVVKVDVAESMLMSRLARVASPSRRRSSVRAEAQVPVEAHFFPEPDGH